MELFLARKSVKYIAKTLFLKNIDKGNNHLALFLYNNIYDKLIQRLTEKIISL